MAIPHLPWYGKLREVVAPTEQATDVLLIGILLITVVVLIKGDSVSKGLWAIYLISP